MASEHRKDRPQTGSWMRLPHVVREYSGGQAGPIAVQHQRPWLPVGGGSRLWPATRADRDFLSAAACWIEADPDSSGAKPYASVRSAAYRRVAATRDSCPGDCGVGTRPHGQTRGANGASAARQPMGAFSGYRRSQYDLASTEDARSV